MKRGCKDRYGLGKICQSSRWLLQWWGQNLKATILIQLALSRGDHKIKKYLSVRVQSILIEANLVTHEFVRSNFEVKVVLTEFSILFEQF